MTTTTFTDAVQVQGTANVVQLSVQGPASQSQPLQQWLTNAGAALGQITYDGRLQLGTNITGGPADALIQANYNPSGSQPTSVWHAPGTVSSASQIGSPINWVFHELQLAGTAGVTSVHNALYTKLTHNNSGTATSAELRGATFQAINQAGAAALPVGKLTGFRGIASNAANAFLGTAVGVEAYLSNDTGGSIAQAVAFSVVPPLNNAGTIANLYGLQIPDLTAGTASNYAISTGKGLVSLGDNVNIAGTATVGAFKMTAGAAAGQVLTSDVNGNGTWQTPTGGGGSTTLLANLLQNGSFENWENGTSAAPNNWTLNGAGSSVAREGTIIKHGLYSAKVTRSGTDCHLSQNVYTQLGSTYIRGRTICLGAWVYATVANRARLRMSDGTTTTYSSYHPGTSAWQFLTVSATIGNSATSVNVGLAVDTGDTSGYVDGTVVVEGSAVSDYAPQTHEFNSLPKRATLWIDEAIPPISMVYNIQTSHAYNFSMYQSTPNNGDTFTWSFFIQAGTYTLYTLGLLAHDSPKLDYSIDGVSVQTGQDWYAAGAVANTVKSFSVTIAGDGYHTLKITVDGKNASSINYYIELTKVWLVPASD